MDMRKAHNFFTEAELARIKQAVADAESTTSGEIAAMVVDQSDSYRDGELLGGILLSGLVGMIVVVLFHHVAIWSYIPLVFILFFPSRLLFRRFPRLKLPFLHRRTILHAVRDRAVRAFFEKGLYRTREETGVLIFISLLERKVWILGDRGINSRIVPHFWRSLAADLARGLREGGSCDALCRVIAGCGEELARYFPKRGDDVNELSDDVIR